MNLELVLLLEDGCVCVCVCVCVCGVCVEVGSDAQHRGAGLGG